MKHGEVEKTNNNGSLNRVRIAILGKMNVGKSALTVRYLTRRYIGEYRSNTDLLYRQTVVYNNMPIDVEIIDVSGETTDVPEEQIQWSDCCVVVYSITDKNSFKYALDMLENLQQLKTTSSVPVTLLANKADLEHLRQVEESDGRNAALQYGCQFYEVSVAENSNELYQAFESIISELKCINNNSNNNNNNNNNNSITKLRKFSVTKMIGTLIGKDNGGGNKNQQCTQGGTVVVIQKSDLCKNRSFKHQRTLQTANGSA